MAEPLRVGVLGLAHDHIWPNLQALAESGLGRAVVAADPNLTLRERLGREQPGIEWVPEFDAVLGRTDLDAVFVYADNRTSADLGLRVLERGLPTMIE